MPQVNALSPEDEIIRLKKGEYYFYYLTEDYPSAMTRLMQLRDSNTLGIELDVMEATMLLSLGLHTQAQEIFEKIQQDGGESSSRSWFYLARRWFELGEFYSVIYSVDQIDLLKIKPDFQLESKFMLASAYMELGEHSKAQNIIADMSRDSIWTGYARHNHIIAMMYGNSSGRSLNLLIEDATFYLPETQEAKHLRDRINLISAIHFLEIGQNRSAMKYLKSISLEGPYTPAALLQYGWASVEQGDYEKALQPWRELQTRFNLFDPDVMESMLGIPQVFELMKAYTQAIKSYESIEKKLLSMEQFITTNQNELEAATWLDSWVAVQSDPRWGWQSQVNSTVPFSDESGLLHQMLSKDSMVNELTEYRDLEILTQYLKEKERDLQLWKDMLKRRKADALSRNLNPQFERANRIIIESEKAYDGLLNLLNESSENVLVLATNNQRNSIEALTSSTLSLENLIELNNSTRNIELYQQRWSRVNGLLLWKMNETEPKMQWQLQRDLINTKRYIAEAHRQLQETKLADKWSDSSWYGLADRVDDLLFRTSKLHKKSEENRLLVRNGLMLKAQNYLISQQKRIKDYLAQSRLSIARLYDEALQRRLALGDVPVKEVRP
jgi:hypothetical protein